MICQGTDKEVVVARVSCAKVLTTRGVVDKVEVDQFLEFDVAGLAQGWFPISRQ